MQLLCKVKMIYLDIPNFIFSLSSPLSAANSLESFSLLGKVQNENKVPMQSQPNANAKKSLFLCQNSPNILMELIIWSHKLLNNVTFNEHCIRITLKIIIHWTEICSLSSSIFRVRHLSRDGDDDAQFHEGGVCLRRELGQKAQDRTLLTNRWVESAPSRPILSPVSPL